ncbi:MAG TPA: antitoxin Xre/MbcA/ParS toxin-binding domain-containing protein [Longimicrobium sp.]|jgi:DNA-directed RNA polymerase specialized sigma24 family protein
MSFAEERLVARAQQGDDTAFAELVRRHYRFVHTLLARRMEAGQAAEAAAQVFAYASRHLGEADPSKFADWLHELAARHVPPARVGMVRETGPAYGAAEPLDPGAQAGAAAPERAILMGDYFQARRGFPSDEALAAACGIDPRGLRQLKLGARADAATARLLGNLAPVVRRLLDHYEPEAVPDWLQGRSPDLGGRRPIDVLREDGLADVLAVIEAQASGAFA